MLKFLLSNLVVFHHPPYNCKSCFWFLYWKDACCRNSMVAFTVFTFMRWLVDLDVAPCCIRFQRNSVIYENDVTTYLSISVFIKIRDIFCRKRHCLRLRYLQKKWDKSLFSALGNKVMMMIVIRIRLKWWVFHACNRLVASFGLFYFQTRLYYVLKMISNGFLLSIHYEMHVLCCGFKGSFDSDISQEQAFIFFAP